MEYPDQIQVRLVNVLCCIHNIIRIIGGDDDIDEEWIREFNKGRRSLEMARDDIVVSKAITSTQSRQANAI